MPWIGVRRGGRQAAAWMPRVVPYAVLWSVLVLVLSGCATLEPQPREPAPAPQPEALAPSLRVGILGDQTGTYPDSQGRPDMAGAYRVLQQGVQVLNSFSPQVVLHVGDLVENLCPTCSTTQVRADFATGTRILDTLRAPWYLSAGDHDVNPPAYQQNSPDRSRETLFKQLYGPRIPSYRGDLWYSFDVQGYHFVSLYSSQALWTTPRFGDIFLSQIQDDQLAWLERDLASARAAGTYGIVVFLHHPLWYHWSGWQRVHEVLRSQGVAAVVAGHFHYQQDNGTVDGIQYLTVGATGGKTKDGSRQAGDVQHVTVLDLSGPRVAQVRLLALDGQPLQLTPRREMDRVQALDVELGNLGFPSVPCTSPCCPECTSAQGCFGTCTKSASFAVLNPVWLGANRLVSDCTTNAPAEVEIVQIGNPLDLPATVTVAVGPPAIALVSPKFNLAGCGSGTSCTLPVPSQNVSIANYSSVDVASTPSLWEAQLALQGATPSAVDVTVTVRYQPDSGGLGPLHLQHQASIPVQICP